MIFRDIPSGTDVFLDANTFVYHFIQEPTFGGACTTLLERIENGEVDAHTSSHILAEVAHRLMTIEACSKLGMPYRGIAARLRRQPEIVSQLSCHQTALAEIEALRIVSISVAASHVREATNTSRLHGLLTNDALLVAVMQQHGLSSLASNDADFDRIVGIQRFRPV